MESAEKTHEGLEAGNGATDQPSQDDVTKKLLELETQAKEKDAKYLYLYAEFENYKKRTFKEQQDMRKYGWESVARDLLQVLDNLDRALAHTPAGTDKNLVLGLQMVVQQFQSSLQRNGVEAVQSVGKPFDPNFQEAVGEEASDQEAGMVIQEQLKGYTLHGRLLRPSRVVVSKGKI